MSGEITIPALPCASINDTQEFYVALGFEVTYRQERPNNYVCVKYGDIDLHFFSMKGYEPKNSYSTCIVLVPDLAALHEAFRDGLRAHSGRLPLAGIPRISKLNNSNSARQMRFNVIDPGGNWIRFAQIGEQPPAIDKPQLEGVSKLSRATQAADWLVESQGDFAGAAELLDKALANGDTFPLAHRAAALVLRASLALSLSDPGLARKLLADVRQISLTGEERAALTEILQTAAELEGMLS